jgi:hypothetical protein
VDSLDLVILQLRGVDPRIRTIQSFPLGDASLLNYTSEQVLVLGFGMPKGMYLLRPRWVELGNLKRNAGGLSGAYLETQVGVIHGGHSGGPVLNSRGEVVGWVMRKLGGGSDAIDEFRPVETPDPKYYDTPMQSFWGALAAATSDVDVARQDWRDTVALRRRLDTTIVPLDEGDRVGEQAEGRRTKEAAAAAAAAATTAAATAAAMAAAVEAQQRIQQEQQAAEAADALTRAGVFETLQQLELAKAARLGAPIGSGGGSSSTMPPAGWGGSLYGLDAKKKRKGRDDDDDEPTGKRRKGRDRINITFQATSEWLASKLRDRDTFKEELLIELECEGWGACSPAKPSPARRLT